MVSKEISIYFSVLKAVTNIGEEKLCRYCSGTFNDYQKNLSSTDLEIEAIILVLEKFQLFSSHHQFQQQFVFNISLFEISVSNEGLIKVFY